MYPILEFDPERISFIEPSETVKPRSMSEHCVICFFSDIVEKVAKEFNAQIVFQNRWEDGPHPVYEIENDGKRLAFFQPGVGAPMASGLLEEVIAAGCRKFIAVGGCGVLESYLEVGDLIVVKTAVRDEGVSYHYLPPEREIHAQVEVLTEMEKVLKEQKLEYVLGKTWTTDAPYRETRSKIKSRLDEGCVSVEMEAAGLMAVAQFRDVAFGQILYAGDDLSSAVWDNRDWQSKTSIRYHLFWLAATICLNL
jgi:uridine phosphorylase